MLSRTADHLFWMARYTERAENTARMLDVHYQTSLLPQSDAVARQGWEGLLRISELMPAYQYQYGEISARDVLHFMAVSYTHLTLPTMKCRCRSRWSPYH